MSPSKSGLDMSIEAVRGFGFREIGRAAHVFSVFATRVLPAHLGLRHRGLPRHQRLGRSLKGAFEVLGPSYVKIGQLIASSPGVFPDGFAEEFKSCLDEVPPVPYRDVRAVILEELGKPPEDLYAAFDPVPVASASIAQVHHARLHDGEEVVVKVQRPGIKARMRSDLRIAIRMSRLLELRSAQVRTFNPIAFIEDLVSSLSRELDFMVEGASMERFGANLIAFGNNPEVRVPQVRWSYTSTRVLTMERIYGFGLEHLIQRSRDEGIDYTSLLKKSTRAWMESAFEHGFFHGDLHSGNIMVDTEDKVVFLDFGIMGTLDGKVLRIMREGLPRVILENDAEHLALAFFQLDGAAGDDAVDRAAKELADEVRPMLSRSLSEMSFAKLFASIIRVGARHGVRLPADVILLSKVMLYVDRYIKVLAPQWEMLSDPDMIWFLLRPDPASAPGDAFESTVSNAADGGPS